MGFLSLALGGGGNCLSLVIICVVGLRKTKGKVARTLSSFQHEA